MRIDADRLAADVEALARIGLNEHGGVDRAAYSPADQAARQWLAGRCADAGIGYREDAIGNIFMRLDPPDATGAGDRPPVWTGSHIDAVPNGGRFDGAAGVLAALEVLRRLREQRAPLRRPVDAVAWVDEEGCYLGLLGSTAVAAGGLAGADLDAVVGRDGRTLRRALTDTGRDPAAAAGVGIEPGSVHAYVELHVEQGDHLERAGDTIGVVTGIVGLVHGQVAFHGRADHAGTTPMDRRRDALRGAGEFLAALPDLPARAGARDAVATCGRVLVAPGADNIVAETATCRLDLRHSEGPVVERLEHEAGALARECADRHDLDTTYRRDHLAEPTPMDAGIRGRINDAADALRLRHRPLASGAGHDAQMIARLAPTGMLFVPSRDGRSHSPAEHTDPADVARGADVLLHVVHGLAVQP